MSRVLSEATRAKLREAGRRSAAARFVDLAVICDAIRATERMLDAADRLGMTAKALSARLSRFQALGSLPDDVAAMRRPHAGRARVITEAGRERMRESGRHSPGRPAVYDRAEVVAVLGSTTSRAEAAAELGINLAALNKRVQWLRDHDALPDDLPALRRKPAAVKAPKPVRPPKPVKAPKPAVRRAVRVSRPAAVQPSVVRRPAPAPKPVEPEHVWQGPKLVVELPTPVWPVPLPVREVRVDDFAARRAQAARSAAERSWRQRHPEAVA